MNADLDLSLKVSDLLKSVSKNGDELRLRQTFADQDVAHILKLKTSLRLHDTFLWGFSKTRTYTSKSGYTLLDSLPEMQTTPPPSMAPIERNLWSNLWKVKTSPKVRHFLRRALAEALAVSKKIQSRGIQIDPLCSSCRSEPETVCHVLFHCRIARETWELSAISPPSSGFSANSVFLNFHHLLSCVKRQEMNTTPLAFPWILWHLWKAKNTFIFEKKRLDPHFILSQAVEDTESWLSVNQAETRETAPVLTRQCITPTWQRPSRDQLNCNVGSSWVNARENCGESWRLRNHHGSVLFHIRRSYSKVSSRFESNLLGLLLAAECLRILNHRKVTFECSSR